nr:hypothetical protein Iba_chr01bCG18840 [Ipomoea batatas]
MSVLVLSCGIGGGPGGSGGLIIGGGPKGGLGISGTITPGGGGWPTIPGGGLISVGGGGGGNREIPGSNISVCKVGIIAGPAGPGTKACCLGGGGGGGAILNRSSDPAGALESFSEDAPSDLDCDPGGGGGGGGKGGVGNDVSKSAVVGFGGIGGGGGKGKDEGIIEPSTESTLLV